MHRSPVVYTIGEALIDFIPDRKGLGLKDVESFRKAAGGAPANVACAVSKLGGASAFIGMLGCDSRRSPDDDGEVIFRSRRSDRI